MNWFDIILGIALFSFVWGGLWTGLIQSVGGLVGLFIGQLIASRFYEQFAGVIKPLFGENDIVAKIGAFLLLFLLITRLIGAAFFMIEKMFNVFAIFPGLKAINRLGGAAFGFLEGALFIGITLQFIVRLPISLPFASRIDDSVIAGYALSVTAWLVPLFPKILKDATNAIDKVVPK